MDKIEELLPGLEEFLTNTLASETLSPFAEERRQFFIERLDIVKLPPTVPPREGRVLPPELLKETEETSGIPATHGHSTSDFAATQREISRSLVDPSPYLEDVVDGSDNVSDKGVKVYDDIDPADSVAAQNQPRSRPVSEIIQPTKNSDEENEDENDLYEIPVARQQLSAEEDSLSQGVEGSGLATAGNSAEEQADDILDTTNTSATHFPPPLPPRRDIRFSDSGSRTSINEDRPPELPFRPPLPKRNELYTRSDKSDRSEKSGNSDPDISGGEGDSTSYESFEEDTEHHDLELMNKLNIRLPKKPKKKSALKKSKKLSKSRSSSQWEISVPFRKLENVELSGELYHKGKLSWNRRIVAISNGCLAMYKPDKEARPLLVIPLTGYEATVSERESRKGYEVKMTHPTQDSHTFSVDFKDWANLWTEHINGTSCGQPPPKYFTHLARSFSSGPEFGATSATHGSKTDLSGSNSNLSTGSDGGYEDSTKSKMRGNKVMRMGSFAFRATQFFENIGKKTTAVKRKVTGHSSHPSLMHSSSVGDYADVYDGIVEETSISSCNSVGNLHQHMLTPTSDITLPSVLGEARSSSSLPSTPLTDSTNFPLPLLLSAKSEEVLNEVDDECYWADVNHKGYLSIFSSFNKRRWGKRFCMVRQNMFECYKSDRSQQCELNFLLRPCVLRRAVAETNSELGLMILEDNKEKITVEPMSKEEMGQWVRILISETSTPDVPEGLEDYMHESEGDDSSLMSFSVLKQWDMGNLVPSKKPNSHDYEDPHETLHSSDSNTNISSETLATDSVKEQVTLPSNNEEVEPPSLVLDVMKVEKGNAPKISNHYNKHKNTTDSGFYSVKGANSDSDSSCENMSKDTRELDSGYATLDSRTKHGTQSSKVADVAVQKHDNEEDNSRFQVQCANSTSPQPASSTNMLQSASSLVLSHTPSTVNTSISQHRDGPQTRIDGSPTLTRKVDLSTSASSKSKSSSILSSTSTILSPSGEEYSIVLKRSERASKSPESNREPNISSVDSSHYGPHTSFTSDDNVFEDIEDSDELNEFADELLLSVGNDEEPYYEPVGTCNSQNILHDSIEGWDISGTKDPIQQWECLSSRTEMVKDHNSMVNREICPFESTSDCVAVSLPLEHLNPGNGTSEDSRVHAPSIKDTDAKPPLQPTTTAPELKASSQLKNNDDIKDSDVLNLTEDILSPLSTTSRTCSQSSSEAGPAATSPTLKPGKDISSVMKKKKKGNRPVPLRPAANAEIVSSLPLCNGETSSPYTSSSLSRENTVLKAEHPVTPTTDDIAELVENPTTTTDELNYVIEGLKLKLSEIKRKRMAVHDKHLRVSSDEERLACEKEIAALDREGESIDLDIRVLQNQVNVLQGLTLEAMTAAQGKRKPGSRKKRSKKK